jgi:mutator protein MutT
MGTTVLTFGTFDQLDTEHRFFLEEAAEFGDRLVVAVARDRHVEQLKGKRPLENEQTRLQNVEKLVAVDQAVLCDEVLGDYRVIDTIRPDRIVIGFDQKALDDDLNRWMRANSVSIPISRLPKFAAVPDREVDIVVGIVKNGDRILLLHRKDSKTPEWDDKWEFPGGKIQEGETPELAMRRELVEETGLYAENQSYLGRRRHDWFLSKGIIRVRLHCFLCPVDQTEVALEERSTYGSAWLSLPEAFKRDLLEANENILREFERYFHDTSDLG